jgi:hypothetical protein
MLEPNTVLTDIQCPFVTVELKPMFFCMNLTVSTSLGESSIQGVLVSRILRKRAFSGEVACCPNYYSPIGAYSLVENDCTQASRVTTTGRITC